MLGWDLKVLPTEQYKFPDIIDDVNPKAGRWAGCELEVKQGQ